ncbi:hypothetical protein BT69DRAFT_952291 [Atractiella rhizophila]|nr:hypothetical protein BT69DRAFT_952291 [Atractiella rhizophila]
MSSHKKSNSLSRSIRRLWGSVDLKISTKANQVPPSKSVDVTNSDFWADRQVVGVDLHGVKETKRDAKDGSVSSGSSADDESSPRNSTSTGSTFSVCSTPPRSSISSMGSSPPPLPKKPRAFYTNLKRPVKKLSLSFKFSLKDVEEDYTPQSPISPTLALAPMPFDAPLLVLKEPRSVGTSVAAQPIVKVEGEKFALVAGSPKESDEVVEASDDAIGEESNSDADASTDASTLFSNSSPANTSIDVFMDESTSFDTTPTSVTFNVPMFPPPSCEEQDLGFGNLAIVDDDDGTPMSPLRSRT